MRGYTIRNTQNKRRRQFFYTYQIITTITWTRTFCIFIFKVSEFENNSQCWKREWATVCRWLKYIGFSLLLLLSFKGLLEVIHFLNEQAKEKKRTHRNVHINTTTNNKTKSDEILLLLLLSFVFLFCLIFGWCDYMGIFLLPYC